jgi:hypothetical protein
LETGQIFCYVQLSQKCGREITGKIAFSSPMVSLYIDETFFPERMSYITVVKKQGEGLGFLERPPNYLYVALLSVG